MADAIAEQAAADAAKAKADAEAQKKPDEKKTWPDDEVKKIIDERDKAKEKARKYDEDKRKAEEAKAIEEGKLKDVLAQREAELTEARKEADAYKLQQSTFRDGLLSKVNDPKLKSIAAELSIPKLQEFVDTLNTEKGNPFSGKHGAQGDRKSEYERIPGENYQQYQVRVQKLRNSRKQ